MKTFTLLLCLVLAGCNSVFEEAPPPSLAPVGPVFIQFDGNSACPNETRVCASVVVDDNGRPIPGRACILHLRLPDWQTGLEHELMHCVLGDFHPHLQ